MVVPLTMLMCMIVVMVMSVIVIMPAIFGATGCFLGLHGDQIEQGQHDETDAAPQNHGPENAIWRQVVRDASADIEVQHDAAPQKQEGDAQEMDADALGGHDTKMGIKVAWQEGSPSGWRWRLG